MSAVRAGIEFEGTPAVVPEVAHAFWTLRRAAEALGEDLRAGPRLDHRALSGVSTDTRTLTPGALFVALRGPNHDAHDHLAQAKAAGAAALVVERAEAAVGLGLPVLVVPDTLRALGLLARAWRRAWAGTVIAVGGSNGKTSSKELLRAALGSRLAVHATKANENNLVGVPLTLLAIPPYAECAVVEVGTNTPGEIAQLRDIVEPDIAVVTSIGEEHLEGLGDLAGVLREEAALLLRVPLAVLPESEVALRALAESAAQRVVTVGLDRGDVAPEGWEIESDGRVRLDIAGRRVVLPVRGVHQAGNAMLAVAVAELLGVPADGVATGLTGMSLPSMRGSWDTVGALTVINDAYNANPPSMRAALAMLRHAGGERQRVAVLGTMRELGHQSDILHDAIARETIGTGVEIIVAVGEFVAAFQRVAPGDPRVIAAARTDDVWPRLQPVLARDAVLLLKASRGVQLERLLPHLTTWATS